MFRETMDEVKSRGKKNYVKGGDQNTKLKTVGGGCIR